MEQMTGVLAPRGAVLADNSKRAASLVALPLFLVLLWLEIIRHLKAEWSFNPQYGYGWSVPFLALYLLWKRWPERPPVTPPNSRALPIVLTLFCAFLFLPIRFLAEANPDWRLLSWALALVSVTISLATIFLAGGRASLRYFGFPFIFFLVAVPWPVQVEQFIIQNLMRAVTAINVSVLTLAGTPAIQHGNVIEVGSGLIGIEEACSGVRSLQATLMISLFLGELYAFSISRRTGLVIAGGILAFACNLIRTAILVWLGANRGPGAIHGWHDPAGLTILLVCLFGLWLLSLAMRPTCLPAVKPTPIENRSGPVWFPAPLLVTLALWLLLVEGGVQLWYHVHQSSMAKVRWSVRWPSGESGYRPVAIGAEAESLLRYNQGGGATWNAPDGRQWMMYFFRWLPGRTAALFVKIHRPDVCLPASGMTMVADHGTTFVNVKGTSLPIRSYRFDDRGAPLHVYYCYWDARSSYQNVRGNEEEDWTARGRVRSALRGQREIGAQMLELAIWGYDDDAAATAALERQLTQIIDVG
jgi:exosortase